MFKKIKEFFVAEKYEGFVHCHRCNYFWHTTNPEIYISFKDLPRFSKAIGGLCQKCKIKQEE